MKTLNKEDNLSKINELNFKNINTYIYLNYIINIDINEIEYILRINVIDTNTNNTYSNIFLNTLEQNKIEFFSKKYNITSFYCCRCLEESIDEFNKLFNSNNFTICLEDSKEWTKQEKSIVFGEITNYIAIKTNNFDFFLDDILLY